MLEISNESDEWAVIEQPMLRKVEKSHKPHSLDPDSPMVYRMREARNHAKCRSFCLKLVGDKSTSQNLWEWINND